MTTVAGIERRLAHEPMHAGLGAQPAVRIWPLHVDRRRFDAGDFTIRSFHQLDLEAAAFGPAQIHRSEEHTSELQSLMRISYAVFCLKKKINNIVLSRVTHNKPHSTYLIN